VARTHLNRVTRCADRLKEDHVELRRAMLAAKGSGETYRDIAAAAGLSHQRVWQIVNEGDSLRGP
jgi:hypothetical protein